MNNIQADELFIGKNVVIEPSAKIRGIDGNAKRVVIGDNTYIGADVQIICDNFEIGDYSKIQHHNNIHGYKPCIIGHNAWIGQYSIIDSIGGANIGNNCCIGSGSHLWSHIKFGDTLEGCRYLDSKSLLIGNDVWIAGLCTVTPITAKDKSMVLAGSVVTKDLEYNHIYAGSPAEFISHKVGFQFNDVGIEEKYSKLIKILESWNGDKDNIRIVKDNSEVNFEDSISYFNVSNRTYSKKLTHSEISFMRFLLPDKAKFTPIIL